jgi:hypothetical protein
MDVVFRVVCCPRSPTSFLLSLPIPDASCSLTFQQSELPFVETPGEDNEGEESVVGQAEEGAEEMDPE